MFTSLQRHRDIFSPEEPPKSEIPMVVCLSMPMENDACSDDEKERDVDIQKSRRPRFLRSKNKDKYPRVEEEALPHTKEGSSYDTSMKK